MMQISGRSFVIAFLVGATAYFVLVGASAANTQSIAGLDQLIPREKWDEAGLNKFESILPPHTSQLVALASRVQHWLASTAFSLLNSGRLLTAGPDH